MAGSTNKLAVDVYIPDGQPNLYWLGAVQLFVSCPSANLNNAYVGQVDLTGKPVGAFSTLTYPLSSYIAGVLAATHRLLVLPWRERQRHADPAGARQPPVRAVAPFAQRV